MVLGMGMTLGKRWAAPNGGVAGSNLNPPPPPPDPPKFSNPSFSRFWGKVLAPKAPKFFFGLLRGQFFFALGSILKILRILWRIQNWMKNTKRILTPDLTSGSDLG